MTKHTRTRAQELRALARVGAEYRIAQLDAERARMVKILNEYSEARQKRRPIQHRANLASKARVKLHWTQRPENKARVQRMVKLSARTRVAKREK